MLLPPDLCQRRLLKRVRLSVLPSVCSFFHLSIDVIRGYFVSATLPTFKSIFETVQICCALSVDVYGV